MGSILTIRCHFVTVLPESSISVQCSASLPCALCPILNNAKVLSLLISLCLNTRCLVQNFQLICYSQRVKSHVTIQQQWQFKIFKMAERLDGCSGETLLAPYTWKKRLQRKMTKDYCWIGVQECLNVQIY